MAKTIIQTIGPLYGEVVNGTVFGRPNGSIFVPSANVISVKLVDAYKYVRYNPVQGAFIVCNSSGSAPFGNLANQLNAIAESQDLQNYIDIEISDSADFSTVATYQQTAGQFNVRVTQLGYTDPDKPAFTVTAGTTYYLRAALYSGSGVAVATSESIELTGVKL